MKNFQIDGNLQAHTIRNNHRNASGIQLPGAADVEIDTMWIRNCFTDSITLFSGAYATPPNCQ